MFSRLRAAGPSDLPGHSRKRLIGQVPVAYLLGRPSHVQNSDVEATDGVIHVINSVMIP